MRILTCTHICTLRRTCNYEDKLFHLLCLTFYQLSEQSHRRYVTKKGREILLANCDTKSMMETICRGGEVKTEAELSEAGGDGRFMIRATCTKAVHSAC